MRTHTARGPAGAGSTHRSRLSSTLITLTLAGAVSQVLGSENGDGAVQTDSTAIAQKDAPQSWAGDTVIVTGKRDGYVVPEGSWIDLVKGER